MSDAATRVDDASELLSELQMAGCKSQHRTNFLVNMFACVCIMRISKCPRAQPHALDLELIAQKSNGVSSLSKAASLQN